MTTTLDELLLPAAEVEIQAAGGKLPTVSIVAYSGGLMIVPGWGPLVIDLAGLEFSSSQVGILADHDSTLKGIVGHGRAHVHDGRLFVAGTIAPSSEAARQIVELAKTGFGFQASVGIAPADYQRVRPGQSVEECRDSRAPEKSGGLPLSQGFRAALVVGGPIADDRKIRTSDEYTRQDSNLRPAV